MNIETLYDAVSVIDEKYITQADNIDSVRLSFRKNKKRKIKTIGTVCVCAAVVIAAGLIGLHGRILKESPENSNAYISKESASYTDEKLTEQTQNRQISQEEADAYSKEAENQNSITENHSSSDSLNSPKTKEKEPADEKPSSDVSVIRGDEAGSSNSSIISWNGKQVGYMLWEVLKSEPSDKTIAIIAAPQIDRQFVIDGKTIAQYEAKADQHKELIIKLQQLLKEGEMLKYGKALYTTGAPNGEKWDKAFYDKRIGYYGAEILSKYIVNGKFLADKAAADLSHEQADTTAQDEYSKAVSAFYSQTLDTAESVFSSEGISCSVTENGKAILLFASADRFAGLIVPGNAEWFFTLAQKNSGDTAATA